VCAQALVRLDSESGDVQEYYPGPRCFCDEPTFVPGPKGVEQEDDGCILVTVYDAAVDRSSVVVSRGLYLISVSSGLLPKSLLILLLESLPDNLDRAKKPFVRKIRLA
jgi:hypothetical protein